MTVKRCCKKVAVFVVMFILLVFCNLLARQVSALDICLRVHQYHHIPYGPTMCKETCACFNAVNVKFDVKQLSCRCYISPDLENVSTNMLSSQGVCSSSMDMRMRSVFCVRDAGMTWNRLFCHRLGEHIVCAFIANNTSCVFTTNLKTEETEVEQRQHCSQPPAIGVGAGFGVGVVSTEKRSQINCTEASKRELVKFVKGDYLSQGRGEITIDKRSMCMWHLRVQRKSCSARLCDAVKRGNTKKITSLVFRSRVNVNCRKCTKFHDKFPPLIRAMKARKSVELFDMLVAMGVDLNNTQDHYDAMFWAVKTGSTGIVHRLYDLGYPLERSHSNKGFTLLHVAAGTGSVDMFEILRRMGHNASDLDTSNNDTVLHSVLVCRTPNCRPEAIAMHILKLNITNVGLESRNKIGFTPLLNAIHFDNVVLVKLLIRQGCDLQARTNNGSGVLHVAIRRLRMVKFLVKLNGVDTTAKNNNGQTPLEMASRLNIKLVVLFLRSLHGPKHNYVPRLRPRDHYGRQSNVPRNWFGG